MELTNAAVAEALDGLPPVTLIALRVSLAALLLPAVVRWQGHRLPRDRASWRLLAEIGGRGGGSGLDAIPGETDVHGAVGAPLAMAAVPEPPEPPDPSAAC